MKVFLHLGEPFWRAAGKREVEIILNDGATISDALASLAKTYPTLAQDLDGKEAKPMLFLNDEEASPEKILSNGAKIHVVWPVSGG
ncbi:MAG: MoaD/ThiS family protein [Chloroflexi bacterium]|nr:MoaD/ThiS family protein [Chloroflexota bacterium]